MSNIVRVPAAATLPAAVGDYQAQNNLLFALGLWGMGAYPLDLANNFVLKGAIFNVGGVLYKASANEGITGTSSNYVKITPISAGAQCSASYVANLSGVSWSDTYDGYVDGSGNLYLFDELLAMTNGAVTVPKTFIGRLNRSLPHGSQTISPGSGNFTVPSGVYLIRVHTWGGGGGGGGCATASGGGGGGGGLSMGTLSVTPGQTIAYSCGAGGTGGSSSPTDGGDGGDTTFTGVTTATGGKGGKSNTNSALGGAGGTGNIGSKGAGAGTGSGVSSGGSGGSGGLGGVSGNGSPGSAGGGGGGGGVNAPHAGGAGGGGLIIVEW